MDYALCLEEQRYESAKVRFRGFLASGTTSKTQPKEMHFRMRLGLGGF